MKSIPPSPAAGRAVGLAVTVLVHAWVAGAWWFAQPVRPARITHAAPITVVLLQTNPEAVPEVSVEPERPVPLPALVPPPVAPLAVPPPPRAEQVAPPAPSAAEWAFASTYTARNSKAYRHTWGQQVRSQMGTAIEGADQGSVRFRIEIAPEGRVVRVDTLWSTSEVAEARARQAIAALPPLPPTPTGRPLVFERTVHYSPFAQDNPPHYQGDCEPEPPAFRNPFAWDPGRASGPEAPQRTPEKTPERAPPMTEQEREDCLRNLPPESIDAALARDRRALERWGWSDRRP